MATCPDCLGNKGHGDITGGWTPCELCGGQGTVVLIHFPLHLQWCLPDLEYPPGSDEVVIRYLDQELQEAIQGVLMSQMPYTDEGIKLIANEVKRIVQDAGLLDVQVSTVNTDNRGLAINFSGRQQDQISSVVINGKVEI